MKKILIAAGGTGGHIYPGLAIADAIKRKLPDTEIKFICSYVGLEKGIIPSYGYPIAFINAYGFEKKINKETLEAVGMMFNSRREASRLLKKEKPDLVIGTGGFVSAMLLLEAARQHYPTLIHEQNSYPGRANRMLGKFVDKIAITFEAAKKYFPEEKVVMTGNPIRAVFKASNREACRKQLGLTPEDQLIVVTGGSQGAGNINFAVVDWIVKDFPDNRMLYLITGSETYESVLKKLYDTYEVLPKALHVEEYSEQMDVLFKAADLVIARAGATSMSEFTAVGTPSVLVPYPRAAGDHQMFNAKALEKMGGAVVISDDQLNGESLEETVEGLLGSPEKLSIMASAAKRFGKPNADESVAEEAIALMNRNKG